LVFSGTYDHTVDAKHRLTLPAAFREVLVGRVVVALSPETRPDAKCVEIWTPEGFSAHVEELLAGTNARLPATRELKRVLHSLSWPTVTVAGAGDCLEVWDRDRWSAYIGEQLANYSDLLKRVDDTA